MMYTLGTTEALNTHKIIQVLQRMMKLFGSTVGQRWVYMTMSRISKPSRIIVGSRKCSILGTLKVPYKCSMAWLIAKKNSLQMPYTKQSCLLPVRFAQNLAHKATGIIHYSSFLLLASIIFMVQTGKQNMTKFVRNSETIHANTPLVEGVKLCLSSQRVIGGRTLTPIGFKSGPQIGKKGTKRQI